MERSAGPPSAPAARRQRHYRLYPDALRGWHRDRRAARRSAVVPLRHHCCEHGFLGAQSAQGRSGFRRRPHRHHAAAATLAGSNRTAAAADAHARSDPRCCARHWRCPRAIHCGEFVRVGAAWSVPAADEVGVDYRRQLGDRRCASEHADRGLRRSDRDQLQPSSCGGAKVFDARRFRRVITDVAAGTGVQHAAATSRSRRSVQGRRRSAAASIARFCAAFERQLLHGLARGDTARTAVAIGGRVRTGRR